MPLNALSMPSQPLLGVAPEVIGSSPAIQRMLRMIDRLAPTDRPVLISGATGAGKEVAANLLHYRSDRADQPFVDVNCGAIAENLVEAELFGHVKGSFTGAVSDRPGYFQMAGKGTLFLDEIGELPLFLQPKLLRVLETRSYRPVGATENMYFDGRVVAATHRDLSEMVREGTFREDLYYRLAVFILELPSLDQRREDIPELVAYFAARQPRPLTFSPEAIKHLTRQSWPGNVRQLRNLIDQLGVLAETAQIGIDALEPFLKPFTTVPPSLSGLADSLLQLTGEDKLAAAEHLMITRALERSGGNKTVAAEMLGTSRKVIERRVKSRAGCFEDVLRSLEHGRRFVDESQFSQAIPLLRRSVEALSLQAQKEDICRLLFDAHRLLGVSLRSVHGWLSPDACASYEAAVQVGQAFCDPVELASLQFGIWTTQLMTLELGKARATAQDMLQRSQRIANPMLQDEAHLAMANTLFWLGDSEESIACLERGGLTYSAHMPERVGAQGFDLVGMTLTFEGLAAFQIGEFGRARQALDALVLRGVENRTHPFNCAIILQGASWLACLFEDWVSLSALATELESVSRIHGFAFYQGIGQFFRGCYFAHQGDLEQAEHAMIDGYENYMLCHGGKLFHSFQALQRGKLLLQAGRPQDCMLLVSHALDMAIEQQDRAYMAELLVIKARALLALGNESEAEQTLRNAMSTAMVLGSVPARVIAATDLAQMLTQVSQVEQAKEVLERGLRNVSRAAPNPDLTRALCLLGQLQKSESPVVHEEK